MEIGWDFDVEVVVVVVAADGDDLSIQASTFLLISPYHKAKKRGMLKINS